MDYYCLIHAKSSEMHASSVACTDQSECSPHFTEHATPLMSLHQKGAIKLLTCHL